MKNTLKVSRKRKWIQAILGLVFLSFAFLQLNDPDPVRWFLVYFLVAGLCFTNLFVRVDKRLLQIFLVVLIAYAAYHLSFFWDWLHTGSKGEIFGEMVYEKPYLEGTREFLGLLLAAGAITYLLYAYRKANNSKQTPL